MPIHSRSDETPVVVFDPTLEISPFTLYKRLRDGVATRLIDVRPDPGSLELAGSVPLSQALEDSEDGEPVVLFDDDGTIALDHARRMQAEGRPFVKALFGGLELYEFSLDPEVVGSDTFLIRRDRPTAT